MPQDTHNATIRYKALQTNPLLPGYPFNTHLVAGLTDIERDSDLDFLIQREHGMKGYIINLTIAGVGQLFDGHKGFQVNPKDLILFPPEVAHHYKRAPLAERWHHRWIYFRPRALWLNWLNWSQQHEKVRYLTIPDEQFTLINQIFIEIEQAINSGKNLAEELAMNRLEYLLLCCADFDPKNNSHKLDPRILEACYFVSQNLDKPLSTCDIANHLCISTSRLTHLFTDQVGISLSQWREEQRMSLAKLLLQSTGIPVYHIAQKVGYDDPLYFSKVFRKKVGLSPSHYREFGEPMF